MPLSPAWKIQRELGRIGDKAARFVGRHVHDPVRKPIYDLTARWRQRVTPGQFALTDRVAVFVVFQPKGVAASVLLTLEHLRRNRYSVLVVSNGALRPEDRETLAGNAALVLERPNVGYDFGAYRDGIRHLWSLNHDLSRLVLMNDSTWFPLRRDDDSLARMEALGADLAGHIFKTENPLRPENDHVEAHLLMVSAKFARSNDFRRFWTDYCMSNQRATTIWLGEKGFSQVALREGWCVKALMDRAWLMDVLRSLDEKALETVFKHTIDKFTQRESGLSEVRRKYARREVWQEAYFAWADKSLRNSLLVLLSSTFVMPAMVYGHMGFAKKSKDLRFHLARQKLLDLEAEGLIPPLDDVVRAEMQDTIQKWVPPAGHEGSLPRRRYASAEVAR
jgi:Rhamnan synthesis protein F